MWSSQTAVICLAHTWNLQDMAVVPHFLKNKVRDQTQNMNICSLCLIKQMTRQKKKWWQSKRDLQYMLKNMCIDHDHPLIIIWYCSFWREGQNLWFPNHTISHFLQQNWKYIFISSQQFHGSLCCPQWLPWLRYQGVELTYSVLLLWNKQWSVFCFIRVRQCAWRIW